MTRKRISTGLSGILAVDKPSGMTSHDVVDAVRRLTKERRVGHAGTLDPLATGLLFVCVGPATRLANYLMAHTKTYEARVCFGTETSTDDAEGTVVCQAELPLELANAAFATQLLFEMTGAFEQLPPAVSAIKKDGVRAYQAARSGAPLELEPRHVVLYDGKVRAVGPAYWDVRLTVSKGFYVRSFARDLGRRLGTAAHLGALRRTACGQVSVEQAQPLDTLAASAPALPFIDPVWALGVPAVEVSATQARDVQNGKTLSLTAASERKRRVAVVHAGRFLALYETVSASGLAKPKVVIPGGVLGTRLTIR
jgi:tRNA pseudouridine55 synthase